MLRRTFTKLAGAALALTLAAPGGAIAADMTITIGHFGNSTPMQLVAASDKLAKETGWTIDWRKFQSGTDVIAAMASGDIKISELGSSPLAIAATQGVDLKLFMISDGIAGAEALVARDGSGIHSAADLKGKRVAVPLGSTSHFSLMGALQNAGVPANEVTILGMSPDQIAAAWAQKQIDAAFIWDPVQTKIRSDGGHIVLDAAQVKGKPTFDGWVVNSDFAKEHKDFMVAFVKAIAAADTEYTKDPAAFTPESAPVMTIAKRTGASPADVPTILKGYQFPTLEEQASKAWLGGDIAGVLKQTADFLKEQKKISKVLPSYAPFVTDEYVKDAMK